MVLVFYCFCILKNTFYVPIFSLFFFSFFFFFTFLRIGESKLNLQIYSFAVIFFHIFLLSFSIFICQNYIFNVSIISFFNFLIFTKMSILLFVYWIDNNFSLLFSLYSLFLEIIFYIWQNYFYIFNEGTYENMINYYIHL